MKFGIPHRDTGVGHGDVDQRQQARELGRPSGRSHLIGDVHRDLVVKTRRRTQTWGSVVSPEGPRLGLISAPHRGRCNSIAAHGLRLVVGDGVIRGSNCWGRWSQKFAGRLDDKWGHRVPVRAQRNWTMTDWILSPLSWI